jgi:hypothetical protein
MTIKRSKGQGGVQKEKRGEAEPEERKEIMK